MVRVRINAEFAESAEYAEKRTQEHRQECLCHKEERDVGEIFGYDFLDFAG